MFYLDVTGNTWEGFASAYRYEVTPEQARGLLASGPLLAERIAGDFASVTD